MNQSYEVDKKIVICADSYLQYKNALYIASHNYQKRPITILISGNPDLFKFFSLINEKAFHNALNLIYFEPFHPDPRRAKAGGLKKVFYVLSDIIRERRYLKDTFDKYVAEVQWCEVFVLDRGFMQFSLAKKLGKRNWLVYISSYPIQATPTEYTPTNIADLARWIIIKLIYGSGIALGKLPHVKGFPFMPDRFLKKEFDRAISGEERDEMMKDFELSQFKIFDTSKYRVIYFDDDLIGADYIGDKDTFRRELAEIFHILSKHFAENEIARKYHPGYRSDKTVTKIGDVLPDFIPAELLYNDSVKMYFGACSVAMTNVEKGVVISILDLVSFGDEQTRETLKEILLQTGRSKILFPESLDEFEKIVIGLSHRG